MLEIKGKVNTAICYAKVIEDEAVEQIRRMCDYPEYNQGDIYNEFKKQEHTTKHYHPPAPAHFFSGYYLL